MIDLLTNSAHPNNAKHDHSKMVTEMELMILSRWQRFGYACVNFGEPVSVKAYCREHNIDFRRLPRPERFEAVARLAQTLMEDIRREVPVLPVPMLAAVFDAHPQSWMTATEIEHRAVELLDVIVQRGANIYQPARDRRPHYVAEALNLMRMRHFIEEQNGRYRMNPDVADIMRYYANSVVLASEGGGMKKETEVRKGLSDAPN